MSDITKILSDIRMGSPSATDRLLPIVYSELRKLAGAKLAKEKPGQSLNATALVHEAYLRLVNVENPQDWNGRGHFFGAAAEAMRRIIVERARSRQSLKRGGDRQRIALDDQYLALDARTNEIIAINEALEELQQHDHQAAELVKLRYFVGLEHQEAAKLMGISRRAADRLWLLARTWLARALKGSDHQLD